MSTGDGAPRLQRARLAAFCLQHLDLPPNSKERDCYTSSFLTKTPDLCSLNPRREGQVLRGVHGKHPREPCKWSEGISQYHKGASHLDTRLPIPSHTVSILEFPGGCLALCRGSGPSLPNSILHKCRASMSSSGRLETLVKV